MDTACIRGRWVGIPTSRGGTERGAPRAGVMTTEGVRPAPPRPRRAGRVDPAVRPLVALAISALLCSSYMYAPAHRGAPYDWSSCVCEAPLRSDSSDGHVLLIVDELRSEERTAGVR
eukprot:COSAG02_NODE_19_length_53976_cov_37.338512_13_plen_117_part_00